MDIRGSYIRSCFLPPSCRPFHLSFSFPSFNNNGDVCGRAYCTHIMLMWSYLIPFWKIFSRSLWLWLTPAHSLHFPYIFLQLITHLFIPVVAFTSVVFFHASPFSIYVQNAYMLKQVFLYTLHLVLNIFILRLSFTYSIS